MPIPDSDWAKLTPFGATPITMASAATIAPSTGYTVLTGNTAVVNITPPINGPHMLMIEFAGTAGVTAAGNIKSATASVAGQIMLLVWNTAIQKYVPVG
jgi:hypothetical protein